MRTKLELEGHNFETNENWQKSSAPPRDGIEKRSITTTAVGKHPKYGQNTELSGFAQDVSGSAHRRNTRFIITPVVHRWLLSASDLDQGP